MDQWESQEAGFKPWQFDLRTFALQFSSVQSLSRVWLSVTPWTTARQASLYPNPCLLSRWCNPTISFSVIPFSSCPQSFPASESFQMSQLFTAGGQSIGVLASTSVLPMNTQVWGPLRWTGWISLQSKGLSRVFALNQGLINYSQRATLAQCVVL